MRLKRRFADLQKVLQEERSAKDNALAEIANLQDRLRNVKTAHKILKDVLRGAPWYVRMWLKKHVEI